MEKLKTILLIDDDVDFTMLTSILLRRMEMVGNIECLHHANTALQYLLEYPSLKEKRLGEKFPQVIFLDINMPGMDGFTFLEKLQQTAIGLLITSRIVVLSSSISQKDKQRALNYGVQAFVEKPLTEEKMYQIIERLQDAPVY